MLNFVYQQLCLHEESRHNSFICIIASIGGYVAHGSVPFFKKYPETYAALMARQRELQATTGYDKDPVGGGLWKGNDYAARHEFVSKLQCEITDKLNDKSKWQYCTDCGSEMRFVEGCYQCYNCGYMKS